MRAAPNAPQHGGGERVLTATPRMQLSETDVGSRAARITRKRVSETCEGEEPGNSPGDKVSGYPPKRCRIGRPLPEHTSHGESDVVIHPGRWTKWNTWLVRCTRPIRINRGDVLVRTGSLDLGRQ